MPTSYYKQDEHTSRNFRDGWFYPGDVGRFNEDGLLFVEGRNDNVLNIDGHKVNPSTIERVLEEHPKVSEAVVFSLPDSGSHGTRLAAALLTKDGTQDGLKEYCAQHLSPPLPSVFIFMDDFPRNPNGKVLRDALLSFVHTNRSS
jgi:acyl-CoA synthetase (AMP-forming)/AMP-acid ligase II